MGIQRLDPDSMEKTPVCTRPCRPAITVDDQAGARSIGSIALLANIAHRRELLGIDDGLAPAGMAGSNRRHCPERVERPVPASGVRPHARFSLSGATANA